MTQREKELIRCIRDYYKIFGEDIEKVIADEDATEDTEYRIRELNGATQTWFIFMDDLIKLRKRHKNSKKGDI